MTSSSPLLPSGAPSSLLRAFAVFLREGTSKGIQETRVKNILLIGMRISAAFAAVNKPWTHHIRPNRVQRHPLVTSGAESAMGFHFATVGLTMEELESLLLGLAMTLGRL